MMGHIKVTRVGSYTLIIGLESWGLDWSGMPVLNTMYYASNRLYKPATVFLQEYGEPEGKHYRGGRGEGKLQEVIDKLPTIFEII